MPHHVKHFGTAWPTSSLTHIDRLCTPLLVLQRTPPDADADDTVETGLRQRRTSTTHKLIVPRARLRIVGDRAFRVAAAAAEHVYGAHFKHSLPYQCMQKKE